jgi:hypothetical protein
LKFECGIGGILQLFKDELIFDHIVRYHSFFEAKIPGGQGAIKDKKSPAGIAELLL